MRFDNPTPPSAASGVAPYTWAQARALSPFPAAGMLIRITDLGIGSSLWISDGTILRPINGAPVTTAELSADVVTTGTTNEVVIFQSMLPIALLRDGGTLRMSCDGSKTGSANTLNMRLRWGPAGTIADPTIKYVSGILGGSGFMGGGMTLEVIRLSATSVVSRGNNNNNSLFPMGASNSTPYASPVTVSNLDTAASYLSLTAAADGTADTFTIKRGARIELVSVGN